MKKIAISILFWVAASASAQNSEWKTIKETSFNKELPRSEFMTYTKKDSAMTFDFEHSSYYATLDGSWKFQMFDSPDEVPSDIFSKDYNFSKWGNLTVPGTWELSGLEEAKYADGIYTFSGKQGELPAVNPTGVYMNTFTVPFDWTDKDLFLRVDGITGGCYVYINGEKAGYSEDSGTHAEFNITNFVNRGKNIIVIEQVSVATGSYLECHKGWRMTGIIGGVYLYCQPRIRVRDLLVRTTLDPTYTNGLLQASVLLKTQLLNPHTVTVYFDLYSAKGNLVSNGFKNINISSRKEDTVSFTASIDRVKKWSAEDPYLYTMLVRVQREGRYTEYLATKVGFRESKVEGGKMFINGEPIVFRGVNYRAIDPAMGYTVSKERIFSDLKTMKDNGINAIHTFAGPESRYMYDIADSLGLYVFDGANLNSKASGKDINKGGTLANNPEWMQAHTERVAAVYEMHKTHPSVVAWSMGNNAGNGYNMYQAFRMIKGREDTRPVLYGDAKKEWNTDILFPSEAGKMSPDRRPVILSEAPVEAKFWKKVIDGKENFQGGFIDQWSNQSITKGGKFSSVDDNGSKKALSGGKISAKALISTDGTPTDELRQIAKLFGDVIITNIDPSTGEVKLKNNMYFTNLNKYIIKYQIISGSKVIKNGEVSTDIAPRSSGSVIIPVGNNRSTSLRLMLYDENKLMITTEASI